ncbi:MAG: hypothetical protein ACREAY_06755 [Nitrososphaera sp.]|uniref:hypothetical protein n=1 Tax=Nitrososphaera sp. TaxID=1971748 RepID=UPI003D6FFD49
MVGWSYIIVCRNCGYISTEKLPEKEAKAQLHAHVAGGKGCTTGHIDLMKVRT